MKTACHPIKRFGDIKCSYISTTRLATIHSVEVVIPLSAGTEAVIERPISGKNGIRPSCACNLSTIAHQYISRSDSNSVNQQHVYANNAEFVDILRDSIAAVAYDTDLIHNAVGIIEEIRKCIRQEHNFLYGNLIMDNTYTDSRRRDVLTVTNRIEAGYYPVYCEFIKTRLSYTSEPCFQIAGSLDHSNSSPTAHSQ
ncbi:hypothetical protein CDEST_11171 [Colletotrichum destructivum]|uniref:Uncharacterized protein n=1 Tax=Colletotrichum destructivum TaxID=34406 RepID=A0AAX4ISE7_9PEZI|nr:hypothetical protein CDEST_11171 [Colletotrichum destructivum]